MTSDGSLDPVPRANAFLAVRRAVLAAILSPLSFAFLGCASAPKKGDPRLQAELSRTLGVPQAEFRWVAAVDWSRHEGWWRPNFGVDLLRGTVGALLGDATSTGVLVDDALVIARSGAFSVSYRVLQRFQNGGSRQLSVIGQGCLPGITARPIVAHLSSAWTIPVRLSLSYEWSAYCSE